MRKMIRYQRYGSKGVFLFGAQNVSSSAIWKFQLRFASIYT